LYAWAALFTSAVVGLSIATAPLVVLAGVTLVAVLVLVLFSIPRLRWWERRGKPVPTTPVPARHDFSVTDGSIANSGIQPPPRPPGGIAEASSADPTATQRVTRASGTIVPLSGANSGLPIERPDYGQADSVPR
jgi:hypothetical protein